MIPHKNIVILVATFVSIMLLIVARHHPPSRRKIKKIWHGHVYWEKERDTTVNVTNMSNLNKYDTTMLRSSPEKAFEKVEPSQISEPSTKLENVEPPTNLPEMTFPPPKRAAQLPTVTKSMIAICAATRSKNWRSLYDTNLQNTLIPSIERTISISDRSLYDFRLYLAADHDDHFWLKNQNNVKAPFWLSVHVGFYEGPEHKIPFNPMMRAAYNDGAEYMVRINDDSEFVTSGWVSKAVSKLASYDPPNVGVVGPTCADNAGILTHDMVHRTHLDIFEYYYPRVFSAWWIDDWITYVYGAKRSTKMINWTVNHHRNKYGTRYNVQYQEQQLLKGELEKGAAKIEAWLEKSPFAQIRPSDIIDHSLSAKKTVIIAAAIGYGIYEFKNFVIPLRKVYTGDVTLFVNAKLPSDVVELCKRHNIFTRALPTGSRLGVKGNRYIGYAEVCSNYQWCFATDFRDVFFQENPFLKLPNADLILFEEENHVKMGYRKDRPMCRPTVSIPCTCPYNANWIRTCWGNDFLSSIANETPICSGTIMGTPRGFAELKDKMLAEMDTTDSKDGCTARDQGHLNYLYFANQIDVPTVVQLRGEGIVNTVGYITPRTTINDHLKGGYVVNKDDKASAVVHQYDRFPELKALLRELVHWKKLINTPLDTPNQETPSASHLNIVPKDIEGTVGSQAGNHVDKLISNTLFQKDFVGTFVEFGCSNGIRNSNSLLLEREYGWNGLCIEPNPFEATFAIKNRKHGIHALLSYPAQDYKYAAMSGHCAQGSGIVEFMNEKSKNNLKTCPQARGEQLNYVTIPGVNLETLLEENHMPSVTWISADCEGCELTFIQNFDFDKYDVRVFSYETSANRETGAKIENLLAEKGFSKHNWKGNDAVYTRSLDRQTEGKPSSKIVTATEPLATPNQHTPNNDYVTNKKYIDMCTVSYKTRSKNDFRLPLTPNSIVCVKGDTATLTSFFQLNIRQPFTLVTIEMDDAVPQNALWLNHKYLKRWYSWNSKHSDVIPIPIGLNGDSQLDPMRQTTPVTPKIEMVLANFKQDRPVRVSLFNKVKDLSYVHVESYSQKWQNTQKLSAHYESISKYKWTLCPRGEGQDTHRLWEALYLGSIPIVLKSSISPLYEGLPVIQLNNWEELSLELLQERSKSLTMDRTNAYFKHWENTIRSQTNKIELPQASPNRVISYSLYGSNPRYTDGALANAKLVKDIYPDWIMRVYYDDTVPQKIIQQLRADGVQLVDMSGLKMNKMSWRFQAAKDAGRFCARDIDSRLSKREASAVQEWKESGKQFHVMRDHPSHSHYAMSGGMWCSTTIPNMQALLTNVENQAYLQDMNFLNKVIWPIAQKSLLQHDSFSCDKFGGGKPFPTPRVGWEHVGSVYINGKMRQGDVDILKQKGVVQQCSVLPSL